MDSIKTKEFKELQVIGGIRYQQPEPVWGGKEDTAAGLRAVCAAGMACGANGGIAVMAFAGEWRSRLPLAHRRVNAGSSGDANKPVGFGFGSSRRGN